MLIFSPSSGPEPWTLFSNLPWRKLVQVQKKKGMHKHAQGNKQTLLIINIQQHFYKHITSGDWSRLSNPISVLELCYSIMSMVSLPILATNNKKNWNERRKGKLGPIGSEASYDTGTLDLAEGFVKCGQWKLRLRLRGSACNPARKTWRRRSGKRPVLTLA